MRQETGTARLALPVSDRDHILAPETATVTLVEYGDYECPYCGLAHPIVKELLRRFGDQLRFVFRHFPLIQVHPHAEHAAQAAEVAGRQGKFWEMHDYLFEHQDALDETVGVGGDKGITGPMGIETSSTRRRQKEKNKPTT